ncbi:hypothetical protein D3C73_1449290 [compost metagenome]
MHYALFYDSFKSRADGRNFYFHEKPRVRQTRHLEDRSGRQIFLSSRTEKLCVAFHETCIVHLAVITCCANQIHLHLHYVAE